MEAAGTIIIGGVVDGNGIQSVTRSYAVSSQATTAGDTTPPSDVTSWEAASPPVTEARPYLWVRETVTYTEAEATTRYYMTGARGQNGVDAQDIEWAYIRTRTATAPVIADDSSYTDHNGKTYSADDHLPCVESTADTESDNSGVSAKPYECTDDPKGVSDTWPYEWEIKREKGAADANGHRDWLPYSGTMTLHNNLAASALTIDIDNDSDQFGTGSDGSVVAQQTRTTDVTMYYGAQPQAFTSAPDVTLSYEDGTSVPSSVAVATVAAVAGSDNTRYRLTVTVKATGTGTVVFGPTGHSGLCADITGSCAHGEKSVRFTLARVMGGAAGQSPVIYSLSPSVRTFQFARDSGNNLSPISIASQVNILRTEGDTTVELTTAQEGITYSWGFDSEPAQASAQAIGTSITISRIHAASKRSVWLLLSTGDRETLPIVKDGAAGKDAATGTASPSAIWVRAEADGSASFGQSFEVRPGILLDGQDIATDTVAIDSKPSGVTAEWNAQRGRLIVTVGAGVIRSNYEGEVRVSMTKAHEGVEYSAAVAIPVVANCKGVDGTVSQRRYRSLHTATYPYEPPTTETAPDGWGEVNTPSQVTAANRYRWMIERYSNDGGTTWSNWSAPVIDYYLSEDGTSISIIGEAKGVIPWGGNAPSADDYGTGDILLSNNDSSNDYEVCSDDYEGGKEWMADDCSLGDGFLIDGYLWMKVNSTASATAPRWRNVGLIQGPQGPRGDDAPYDRHSYARADSRAANAATGAPAGNIDTTVGTLGWSDTAPAPTADYPYIWDRVERYDSAKVLQHTSYICLTGPDGVTGQRGRTNRFYYYAGEYNSAASYTMQDTQAPYVSIDGNCYLFDNKGVEPASLPYTITGVSPHDLGANPWTQMSSQFQYYMARVVFATGGAYLGSFVISGDWMISQYGSLLSSAGVLVTVNSSNYQTLYGGKVPHAWFDPTDPTAGSNPSEGYRFAPTFAIDGLTGVTYQTNAYLRGRVIAKAGEIGGFTITSDTLENTAYNAAVNIRNSDGTQVVRIGRDATDRITGEPCALEAQDIRDRGTSTNTALYLKAAGGKYNFAFHGEGSGCLDGVIFGYKVNLVNVLTTSNSVQTIEMKHGSTVVLLGSASGRHYILPPKLSELRESLGLVAHDTRTLAVELNIINQASHDYHYLLYCDGPDNVTRASSSEYPVKMSFDNTFFTGGDGLTQLGQGDYIKLLLVYNPSAATYRYRAFEIIRNY